MLKDITLGQFFPGDTLIHRSTPHKLLVGGAVHRGAVQGEGRAAYGVVMVALIVAVRISRVGRSGRFSRDSSPVFIIVFTALYEPLFHPGTELCHFWLCGITLEGVRAAITMMLRIVLLIMGTFLLTYTPPAPSA